MTGLGCCIRTDYLHASCANTSWAFANQNDASWRTPIAFLDPNARCVGNHALRERRCVRERRRLSEQTNKSLLTESERKVFNHRRAV